MIKLNLFQVCDYHYVAKVSWLILDELEGGPVKRATRLSYLHKNDYGLQNLLVEKSNDLEYERITLPIRQVLSELYVNLSNVSKIYFENTDELNYILELFEQYNLPLGHFNNFSFNEDLSNKAGLNNTLPNKCSGLLNVIMKEGDVSDYIEKIESNYKNLKKTGWQNFSDSVSIYDLFCKYHIYKYGIKYAELCDLKAPELHSFNSEECFSFVDSELINFQVRKDVLIEKLKHQLNSDYYSRLYEPFMLKNMDDWSENDDYLEDL